MLKNLCLFISLCSVSWAVLPAFADVDSMSIRFAGGCTPSNTRGDCTIRLSASGSDLDDESAILQKQTSQGRYTNVRNQTRRLSRSGSAIFKFRNDVACYRAITARNGSRADARSNVICERGAGSGSSSSGGSSSAGSSNSAGSNSSASSASSGSSSSASSVSSGSSSSGSSSDDDDDDSSSSRGSGGKGRG